IPQSVRIVNPLGPFRRLKIVEEELPRYTFQIERSQIATIRRPARAEHFARTWNRGHLASFQIHNPDVGLLPRRGETAGECDSRTIRRPRRVAFRSIFRKHFFRSASLRRNHEHLPRLSELMTQINNLASVRRPPG